MEKDKRKKDVHKKNMVKTKMGTWNIRIILGKVEKLVEEMIQHKFDERKRSKGNSSNEGIAKKKIIHKCHNSRNQLNWKRMLNSNQCMDDGTEYVIIMGVLNRKVGNKNTW